MNSIGPVTVSGTLRAIEFVWIDSGTSLVDPAPILLIEATPPLTVQSTLAVMRSWAGPFYKNRPLVPDLHNPPTCYTLRLGNRFYPHMKLVLQLSPDDRMWLFRADSHDKHVCPPPQAPEYQAFCKLMQDNQELVSRIETAWADQGLPTFKTYLREDLARRQGGA